MDFDAVEPIRNLRIFSLALLPCLWLTAVARSAYPQTPADVLTLEQAIDIALASNRPARSPAGNRCRSWEGRLRR